MTWLRIRQSLSDFVGMVACGGFSFGDVLGAGQGWAKSILFDQKLKDHFSEFFHRTRIRLVLVFVTVVK